MADQGDILAGMDLQVEILEDRLLAGIAEADVLKANLPAQLRDRTVVELDDLRFGVDQGENPLGRRKARLHLRPKGGQVQNREEKKIQALQEKEPGSGGHCPQGGAHPTHIN